MKMEKSYENHLKTPKYHIQEVGSGFLRKSLLFVIVPTSCRYEKSDLNPHSSRHFQMKHQPKCMVHKKRKVYKV